MPMNTMQQRAELISELAKRGFHESLPLETGWKFHCREGIKVWFNSQGRFEIRARQMHGNVELGVAESVQDILTIVDRIAASL